MNREKMEEKICGLTREKYCGARREAGSCGIEDFSCWAECKFAFNAIVPEEVKA